MVFAPARRLASPGLTGRNRGYLQKQSSPYTREVQHTVLSVAGLKGELSQAELHFLKARMRGGVLNKARRGELEMRPPIGLVYLPDGSMGIDPDREVQSAIRLVFDTFERTGSAMQTVRYFREEGLRFPLRIHVGAQKGELLWGQPHHSRIIQILHNPRYAGAFVYGRTHTRRKPDGNSVRLKVPREQWQFLIRDVHPAYISWNRFEANQKRLAENTLAFSTTRTLGPPREGPALLQGRVLCGLCGERMGVHYWRKKGRMGTTYVCQEDSVRRGSKVCQRVPGSVVDRAVSDLLLELVQPLTLEVALAVEEEVKRVVPKPTRCVASRSSAHGTRPRPPAADT
jgi:Recombinase/Recombinase zinc beta ribbon domain